MRKGTRRRRKLKKRTREVLVIAAIVLAAAVLVLAGILIHSQKTHPDKKTIPSVLPRITGRASGSPSAPEKVILGEQLLIKGCLFDLGISKESIRIRGRSIDVTTGKPLQEQQIRYAFAPLAELEAVKVNIKGSSEVLIVLNSHEWQVYFHTRAAPGKKLARVAIIIDDMGLDMDVARRLSSINADLTFSIMPFQAHTGAISNFLHAKGREILLHMPMEGSKGKNPGQGAIYRDMPPEQALSLLQDALDNVPNIVGVNNHMGSEVTQDGNIMRALLPFLKEKNLFFIDSVTSGRTVCGAVASELSVPFEARDVFLDNEQNYAYVAGQIEALLSVAKRHGSAIAICHPHPVTVQVLEDQVPRLRGRGVEVVRVSVLVKDRI